MKVRAKSSEAKQNKFNERDTKSLLRACRKGDLKRVKQLLSEGVDPDAHDGTTGTRPLHSAADNNHIPVARELLKAGADINAREGFDGIDRPLETAAKAGHLDMVRFLMANHAEINMDGVCRALSEAAAHNHLAVVTFLIKNGAKPALNLLSRAMWSCNVSLIELLIESGLKIVGNSKNEDRAIVSMAVRQGNGSSIVELLAKHKANLVSPLNEDGETPLHKAQHEDTALFLIRAGANIHAIDRSGETSLHVCAKRGFTQACKCLLELGANPRAKTKRGYTPRMLAKLGGRQETFNLLSEMLKVPKPSRPQRTAK